jgi:CRP/FNR family transcriptional regulator, cyclic AMP receptor protein
MKTVSLLRADPGLADGMPEGMREAAEGILRAPLVAVADEGAPPKLRGTTALLITEGMLLRRLILGKGRSVELLARGDVLFPGLEDAASFVTPSWKVVDPVRVAAIDLSVGAPIWRWPRICTALTMRALERSRTLAVQAAIMSVVGVEERLHLLLWTLAERWGRVTPEGVVLDLKLHQQVLAEMVGARRPTVSMALGRLCDRGLLTSPDPGCWVLNGPPPEFTPR